MTGQSGTVEDASGLEFTPGLRCPDCGAPYYTGVEAWYRAYAHRLLRLIRGWGFNGTPVDAEDIVHEAFASLNDQLDHIDNRAPG